MIETLVDRFGLFPHPEGGFYKETYRSLGKISSDSLPQDIEGERNYSTAIYFLLTSESFSAFHRIKQDEIWHFYDGAPLEVHMISPEGVYSMVEVGRDFENGQQPQFMVPAGYWFGSRVKQGGAFSFVGCTVSPGFDFKDFELAEFEKLSQVFPKHTSIIEQLTRI
ncbi:MAG: cupin domain-containing protein [Flavobacteriales bacterium]